MALTDTDGKPGLRIETAASVLVRNFIHDHFSQFALVIKRDRAAAKSTHTEYVNGLAGVVALMVAAGHGSPEDIFNATVDKLREYVNRDLAHLAGPRS